MGFFFSQTYGNKHNGMGSIYTEYGAILFVQKRGFFGDFLLPSNDNKKIPLIFRKLVPKNLSSQNFFLHFKKFLHHALKSFFSFFSKKLFCDFRFWTFLKCPFCNFPKKFALKMSFYVDPFFKYSKKQTNYSYIYIKQ